MGAENMIFVLGGGASHHLLHLPNADSTPHHRSISRSEKLTLARPWRICVFAFSTCPSDSDVVPLVPTRSIKVAQQERVFTRTTYGWQPHLMVGVLWDGCHYLPLRQVGRSNTTEVPSIRVPITRHGLWKPLGLPFRLKSDLPRKDCTQCLSSSLLTALPGQQSTVIVFL